MENNKIPLLKKLSKPIQLPSLAKNIHVLMQALANDDLNFRQLAEIIKQYPEITARLIFLANSSWSAPISPINNIEQACSRLGISIVKSISIAIAIAASFDTRRCPYFSTVHFWTSAMLVSEGAGLLASKLPDSIIDSELENTAQTAGVLHNLGLLWLADNLPTETNNAFKMIADDSSLTVSESLQQCTGTDHCEMGGWLAEKLKLPEVLIVAMKHHLNPEYQESSWEIALIVGEAAKMASALHQEIEEVATNSGLEKLGLDSADQKLIFQQLSKNFEKTHELAKTLFEG